MPDEFITNRNELLHYLIFLLLYQNFVGDYIKKINFVNPIASAPKRFYFQEDRKANYRHINMEQLINFLGDPSLSNLTRSALIKSFNSIISSSGIAEEMEIIRDKKIPVVALNIKNHDFWANIADVGYGVSLNIPILFQAWLSESTEEGEILLIEQPEVHLHPLLQAKFIETILSIGSKNQYYIETHSEHILRKLQILIKNRQFGLSPSDVSIHYFKKDLNKFVVTEHKIDENGRLNPSLPSGFFDSSYNLAKELL